MKKKSLAALSMCAVMALSLTSCGFGAPKTPADMFEAYQKAIEDTGYSVDGGINLGIAMDAGGLSIDVPVELEYEGKFYNGSGHGKMDMSMEFFGQSANSNVEFYIDADGDKVTQYTNADDAGWSKSDDVSMNFVSSVTDDKIGTLEKVDDTYVATIPLNEVSETDSFKELFSSMAEDTDMGNLDVSEVLKDATIVYTFDAKTSQLQSIVMDEFEVDVSKAMEQVNPTSGEMSMTMTMSMELTFSDYGKIDADDVAILDEVKDGALDQSELEAAMTEDPILGSGSGSGDIEFPKGAPPANSAAPDEPVDDSKPADSPSSISMSFEGRVLDLPFDYSILTEAGWKAVDDGEYSFLVMKNDNYDGEIYVYGNDYSGKEADLIAGGVFGIDCSVGGNDKRPDMTIAGLTWGASDEDVKTALGEPEYFSSSPYGTSYDYTVKDASAGMEYDISVRVDKSEGLSEIVVRSTND